MDFTINALLLTGAMILIVCIVLALRAIHKLHKEHTAPFRDYFGPEYDRDLLEHSALSETEEWRAYCRPSFTPFRLRDHRANGRR